MEITPHARLSFLRIAARSRPSRRAAVRRAGGQRLSLLPLLLTIGGEPLGEQLAQLAPLWRHLAGAANRLVDADRLGLPGDGDGVELTRLDDLLGEPIGLLAEDDRGAIELVVDALDSAG